MTQDTALNILKTGANIFLTGEPGSGKTHTINMYIDWLKSHGVHAAVTASTGIAATHINGITIHSFSGIGIKKNLTDEQIENIMDKPWVYNKVNQTKVLIIDEISMLDAQTLDDVEAVIAKCKEGLFGSNEPWGGMQVIFVGDFFQLPPVEKDRKKTVKFAFESDAWDKAKPIFCYLTEQHRQEDPTFLEILTKMRCGKITGDHVARLIQTRKPETQELITKLYTHNASVDALNATELQKLPGKLQTYTMQSHGNDYLVSMMKKNCLSPGLLKLKEGALVMFTRNNFDEGYVNGTLGKAVSFEKETNLPIIEIKGGKRIVARPAEWHIEEYGRSVAIISQIPLRLAWAITVHKSQGMSLDRAIIDLSAAFEYGQGYVALSRVRSLEGMDLKGLNDKALEMHPVIVERDAFFKYKSNQLEEEYVNNPHTIKVAAEENFLSKIKGNATFEKRED